MLNGSSVNGIGLSRSGQAHVVRLADRSKTLRLHFYIPNELECRCLDIQCVVLMSCDIGEGLNFFLGPQQTKTKMECECSLDQNSEASRVTTVFLATRSKCKITCKGLDSEEREVETEECLKMLRK